SKPIAVNDDRPWMDPKEAGPNHTMPQLAVNKDGIVGLVWYDRRDHADNAGYTPRFSASLDGGETWLPSVNVSERGDDPFAHSAQPPVSVYAAKSAGSLTIDIGDRTWMSGGHTAGFVADANGVFHELWVDNRSGIRQMYTAPITVKGTVLLHGSPDL